MHTTLFIMLEKKMEIMYNFPSQLQTCITLVLGGGLKPRLFCHRLNGLDHENILDKDNFRQNKI